MKRRAFITFIGGLAIAWPLAYYAQQPKPAPLKRIGILDIFGCRKPPDLLATRRLAELGWIEGRDFVVDCVSTIGRLDQLSALAHELVSRHPDVLISVPIPFIKALKQETTTIPIVHDWDAGARADRYHNQPCTAGRQRYRSFIV